MKLLNSLIEVLGKYELCDNCLGRLCAQLLSNLSNKERGKIIRHFIAFLIDSGEEIEIKEENLAGIKLRSKKKENIRKLKCFICNNFFDEKLDEFVKKILKKIKGIEFETFLIGSIPKEEMLRNEEKVWEVFGIEFVESIKSEINREIGKKISKLLKKKLDRKNPELTVVVDLRTNSIKKQIKSIFIFGKYQKLVRGIPQAKWYCPKCKGKGCVYCKGKGKLYPTSVQEIIEKPLLKVFKAKKSKFHASGREDIDARCLDFRPFVIELVKPLKRKVSLKKLQTEINKSKKVKVKGLKFVDKHVIRLIKTEKCDKTYSVLVTFKKNVGECELKKLKVLEKKPISQKTPLRVLHRRSDKIRVRRVKRIKWKIVGKRKVLFEIRGESGLYIKELITGDEGRTKPSFYEILKNKPLKIILDVIKIHSQIKI